MNGARGEVQMIIDGKQQTLCLTLGALAELETLLECRDISEVPARLRTLSAKEIRTVLRVLLRAGGGDCSVDGVSLRAAAKAIAESFDAALG